MNFAGFLKRRKESKNIKYTKEHYDALGGEKKLGIKLRQFQQIEADAVKPSEGVFLEIFKATRASERKELVTAYMRTMFSSLDGGQEVVTFIDNHLSPQVESETKSLFESAKSSITYSPEQLDYLIKNTDAFRFHRRVLLLGQNEIKTASISKDKIKDLEKMNLITVKGKGIYPSQQLYRIPAYGNSSPRIVGKATDYILKHVETYSAREGANDQELSYAMQMVPHHVADLILEQLRALKRWVQSTASPKEDDTVTPMLFVGLAKKIDRQEL